MVSMDFNALSEAPRLSKDMNEKNGGISPIDPETGSIQTGSENKLHRNLQGRHMQMIAM